MRIFFYENKYAMLICKFPFTVNTSSFKDVYFLLENKPNIL